MAAYRNNNNRRFWPRSTILSAPTNIVENPVRQVNVLTTAAAITVTPTIHERDKVITTIIVKRVANWTIQ